MDILQILIKCLYGSIAAFGFGVLFNVPARALIYVFLFGALGVGVKLCFMMLGGGIIMGTMAGSTVIGCVSLLASYDKHVPAPVMSIPAVIPMVPGKYIYSMMLGILELHGTSVADFSTTAISTITNGLNAAFIFMALSVGVSVPNLIMRKDTFNELRTMHKFKLL